MKRPDKAVLIILGLIIVLTIALGIYFWEDYYYRSGRWWHTRGGPAPPDKVTILSVTGFVNGTVRVNASNIGSNEVVINDAVLKDLSGLVVEVKYGLSVKPLASGETNSFTISFTANKMTAGNRYTVTLVTKRGDYFVSTPFKAL